VADTEVIGLSLEGNFAAQAEKDAAAATKLSESVWKLSDSMKYMEASAKMAAAAPKWRLEDTKKFMEASAKEEARKAKEAQEELIRAHERAMNKLRAASRRAGGLGDGLYSKGVGGWTPTVLQQSVQQSGFTKIVGAVGKLFGDGAAVGLTQGAAKLAEVSDKLAPYMPLLQSGGSALKAGAGLLASAGATVVAGAAALTVAAAALGAAAGGALYAGIKKGIVEATTDEINRSIFDVVNKGRGLQTIKAADKLALEIGIDGDTAANKLKSLLNAKFNVDQSSRIIKIGIGLDAAQGPGAGEKFAKSLELIQNAGKFDAKAIKQFAKEGLSADAIYANLAKSLGVSVDIAKAKVKAGTVDLSKGIDSVLKVADGKFGGLATKLGNTIPGLAAKLKEGFSQLFGDINLGPIKRTMKNLLSVVTGPEGAAFGKAFGRLSDTVIKLLFGPLSGSDGKQKMASVVGSITKGVEFLTAKLKEAAPTIKAVMGTVLDILAPKPGSDGPGRKVREMVNDFVALYNASKPVIAVLGGMTKVLTPTVFIAFSAATKAFGAVLSFILKPLGQTYDAIQKFLAFLGAGAPKARAGGKSIGDGIISGIVNGVFGGMPKALAAAGALAAGVLARVKSTLGIASPSKAFQFVGAMNAEGLAKGMNDNARGPSSAAAKMAAGTAASAGAGGRGGKGAGGDGSPVFSITVVAAPGMTPGQARELGAAAGDGAFEAWKKNQRRYDRELQEGRAT